ncbi:hypothetical protein [Ornithinimicrobium kibberense]|uniref:hypothetical protein n=1 Tax=Ornithinimicrobium kibberense TaxID=282060 RepID=UPI00361873A1
MLEPVEAAVAGEHHGLHRGRDHAVIEADRAGARGGSDGPGRPDGATGRGPGEGHIWSRQAVVGSAAAQAGAQGDADERDGRAGDHRHELA